MKELVIEIFGRVQGVNLRRRLANLAQELDVKGYIKNLDDGSVYCLLQGEEEALEKILSWCQQSNFPTKITGMKFEWKDEILNKYDDFKLEIETSNIIVDEARSLYNLSKNIFNGEHVNVPKHVVIIPDGNRRWAREKGWKAYIGHKRASNMDRLLQLFYSSKHYGVEYLTFWAFSTENWKRDQDEIEQLFKIFRTALKGLKDIMTKEEIRFNHLGRKDRLPEDIIKALNELEDLTKDYNKLHFQLCMDYGGRNSIVEAVNKMIKEGVEEVTEETVAQYLDSCHLPDPDLIIRTSGEQRLSGIMPYESIYSELYFTNVYFPDFDSKEFERAILNYSARKRRFGGTNKADLQKVNKAELIDPDKSSLIANQ